MKTHTFAVLIGMFLLVLSADAFALTAVVKVNEAPWYTSKKTSTYGGTELTRFYAPLPVFFEGTDSSPREEIVEYRWDFGDGSPIYVGFNAAHVYQEVGTYTATLTVRDASGATSSASIGIEAIPRNGVTYYVDSELGNDANPGTSPGTGAWKTATHVFLGMGELYVYGRYNPGDQVLFKRGQTFDLACKVEPGHYKAKYGYKFGAYGTGPKPILQARDGADGSVINQIGLGLAHFTLEDLEFNLTTQSGLKRGLLYTVQDYTNILLNRVDIRDCKEAVIISGSYNGQKSGLFLNACTIYNSTDTQLFTAATRVAFMDSHFELSGNHVAYLTHVDKGVFFNNVWKRPAFGRTALRISASSDDFTKPSNNICISQNTFEGWIDPLTEGPAHNGGGTRYNYLLVNLGPNYPNKQSMEWVSFENNVVKDAEVLINFSCYENTVCRNNLFTTKDTVRDVRVELGGTWDQRPLRNIRISENTFRIPRHSTGSIFRVNDYVGPVFDGMTKHQGLVIENNDIGISGGDMTIVAFASNDPAQIAGLDTDNNWLVGVDDQGLFKAGANLYSLAQWKSMTGDDQSTRVQAAGLPVGGWASAPATAGPGPIAVAYSRASDDTAIAQVRLWAKKEGGAWAYTGLTNPGTSGTFSYTPASSGTYNFALVGVDSAGNVSVSPVGPGDTQTVYSTTGEPTDTTPPNPGVASSPANADSSPIVVTYSGASDEPGGSGLKEVRLWVKKGAAGAWQELPAAQTGASGTFNFTGMTGDDTYYFATRAQDNAGNLSPVPSGDGTTSTVYSTAPPPPSDTTAPSAGVLTAPAYDNSSPITLTFADAGDEVGGSGLKELRLWYKKGASGAWTDSGLATASGSGSFNLPVTASDAYYFQSVATDNAGNKSPAPSGDGMAATVFDNIAPTPGSINVPAVASQSPITITYAGVADTGGSGAKRALLWVKKGDGLWANSGLTGAVPNGTIAYTGMSGDAAYGFAMQAEDNAGNLSSAPSGAGAVCLFDTAAPTVGSVSSPQYAKAVPISVAYSGVSDGTGSGFRQARLWFRKDAGSWVDSGLSMTTASGTFQSSPGIEGTYYYAIRTEDVAGNLSPVPSGDGQTSTVYDRTSPNPGSLSAPANADGPPISVTYSGVSDAVSGLKAVYLWVKKGASGTWANSGVTATAASGVLNYSGMTAADTYYFALQAEDKAGNVSPVPSGDGQAATAYSARFSAGTASSPQYVTSGAITVTYSGAEDTSGGGIKYVYLWAKKGDAGAWANTGLTQTGASGSFSFAATTGDATYYFATRAENNAGAFTDEPTGSGDTSTIYDTTAPNPGTVSSPTYSRQSPVVVSYSGASDAGSGIKEVRLWVKKGFGGAWQDTGLRSTAAQSSFEYPITGDDVYFFFLQAVDNAGLMSDSASDSLVFGG